MLEVHLVPCITCSALQSNIMKIELKVEGDLAASTQFNSEVLNAPVGEFTHSIEYHADACVGRRISCFVFDSWSSL